MIWSDFVVIAVLLTLAEVFEILAQRHPLAFDDSNQQSSSGFQLLGHRVCLRGLAALLGVGSNRLLRLRTAAVAGGECPLDGRLKKTAASFNLTRSSYKRQLIFDFLTRLYLQQAEPAPECNSAGKQPEEKLLQFRRACRRGKRPRRAKKKDAAGSWDEATGQALRMLPPGTYKDYLRLLQMEHPDAKLSFKLFTKAPWQIQFTFS